MSAQHTPEDWQAYEIPEDGWVVQSRYLLEDGRRATSFVAVCNAALQDNEAHAHLFAGALDMLAVLKKVYADFYDESRFSVEEDVFDEVEAAISKAAPGARLLP